MKIWFWAIAISGVTLVLNEGQSLLRGDHLALTIAQSAWFLGVCILTLVIRK